LTAFVTWAVGSCRFGQTIVWLGKKKGEAPGENKKKRKIGG